MSKERSMIFKVFLTTLIVSVLVACYLIFRPFIVEILIATILVTIFYTPYEWLVKKFRNQRAWAAFTMCLLVVLVIIIPLTNLIVYGAQRSVVAYSDTVEHLNSSNLSSVLNKNSLLERGQLLGLSGERMESFLVDMTKGASELLVNAATGILKGTTSFFVSLILIIFTMFFFFIDGKKMLERLMYLTPLPNTYDREIFKKFKDVSYSTMVSLFVVAIAQGILGAIGFIIVGVPAFFAGIAIAFLSIIPYAGSAMVTVPVGVYLLATGQIWQGVFMLIWGLGVVANIDNLIRAYMIKGKAQVHPIFVIFSILGGIILFGFWGVVLGPLIISLAITILHIYEIEYKHLLER